MYLSGVSTKAFCYEQPVEIGADGKADCCPACFRNAAEKSQTGHTHQKVSTHVRRFRAHCGYNRPELSAAEIKIFRVLIVGIPDADIKHSK